MKTILFFLFLPAYTATGFCFVSTPFNMGAIYICILYVNIVLYPVTEVFPWDLIAELVKLCTYPAPRNPFEIDFDYFEMLPVSEKVLATAAMVTILQKILMYTPDHKQYAGQGKTGSDSVVKSCW